MPLPDHWEPHFYGGKLNGAGMFCPHCEQPSTFTVLWTQPVQGAKLIVHYAVLECNYAKCHDRVFLITTTHVNTNTQNAQNDSLIYYPSGKIGLGHESIPVAIREDWVEAQKAFQIEAVKAAAVMCRRILYGVLLDKGCKEHPLHEGIAQLLGKTRMPQILEQWLSEIKEDGHDASHPFRALHVPVENVIETMGYTRELLRFAYIEPFDLQKRLVRKTTAQS